MITQRRFVIGAAALCAAFGVMLAGLATATAQTSSAPSWPTRPVKFIVSLGPGSGADLGARLLSDRLAARWGQPVVVENRPGGDGVVAINAFIGARDDHVLLYTPTSSFTAHPYQHDKLPYDPAELSPVAKVSNTLVGLVAAPALNISSVKELIELIRAQPGKLNYATGTGMTDLIYDGYFKSEGLAITRVSYRDVVAPMTDLGENRIQAYAAGLGILQPHVAAGRARLIAVTNSERAPAQPDVPTVAQAGFPALTFDGLVGLFGPRDMATAARDRVADDIRAVLADPALASRFAASGAAVSPGTSAEFAAAIEGQRAKLATAVKALGIKGN
jgi:tripartite-type tricarboxylate transporter receptor subunit TctC